MIAANDADSSTFAFIGPQRYNRWGHGNVIYVGTTFTNIGDYREDVPAISSRNLHDLRFAEYSFAEQSLLRIDVKYRDRFLVNYVYGFNTTDHIYFITIQKRSHHAGDDEKGYITRLARVCVSDANFDSYTEVTLSCGQSYNILTKATLVTAAEGLNQRLNIQATKNESVLIGAFAQSTVSNDGHHHDYYSSKSSGEEGEEEESSSSSAICAFPMSKIEKLFSENIHNCFNGTMKNRNMEYISGPVQEGKCPNIGAVGNIFNFCEVGLKISGQHSIEEDPLYIAPHLITALAYDETGEAEEEAAVPIIITGTRGGEVIVARLFPEEGSSISNNNKKKTVVLAEQEDAVLKKYELTQEILQLSVFDDDIILLHSAGVMRLPISTCQESATTTTNIAAGALGTVYGSGGGGMTCGSCVGLKNPYCGWCSNQNICSQRNKCPVGDWLAPTVRRRQCVHLEDITPKVLSYSNPHEDILLRINALPNLGSRDHFICIFGSSSSKRGLVNASSSMIPAGAAVESARPFSNGLICPNPLQLGLRPSLGSSSSSTHIPLSIAFARTGNVLLRANLTVFDCGVQPTCSSCVQSSSCSWCIETESCRPVGNHDEDEDAVCGRSSSSSRIGGRGTAAATKQCPKILPNFPQIANNAPTRLVIPITNIPTQYMAGKFFCLVTVEGAKMKISANLRGGDDQRRTIVCDRTSFKYLSEEPSINATVSVLVQEHIILDTTMFTLYKCESVGRYRGSPDCSLCLASPSELGCSWCNGRCSFKDQCPDATREGINNKPICPKPQIFFIHPTSGPIEGGTKLTIEGSNLGTISGQEEEGEGNMTAATDKQVRLNGKSCTIVKAKLSVEIECLTPPASHTDNVTISVESPQGQSTSSVKFQYKDYVVVNASPNEGPKSGGTLVTISGRNFNIGVAKQVYLDDVECVIGEFQQSEDQLVCITRSSRRPRVTKTLVVKIDSAVRRIPFQFHFTPDPRIRQMKPSESYNSGGRLITFHGDYFHHHMRPELLVYVSNDRFVASSPCRVISLGIMECFTPSVKKYVPRDTPTNLLSTGIRVSNISSLLHLNLAFPKVNTDIMYLEDPKYNNFTDDSYIKTYKGDQLVIEGANLASASDSTDVKVSIGQGSCNITSLTNTQLLCVPPNTQPYPIKASYPEVVVHVGQTLSYQVGLVQYDLSSSNGEHFSAEIIGGISATAAIFIFLAGVVLIILKHKSSETEREYKRIQIQMDLLENNVRSECKQAFAELQTDMTDLTMELETTGIPILSRKTFMLNIFFPGVTNHPILIPQADKWPESCTLTGLSMVQFEQLLLNKNFLLTLIECLESQVNFSIRDRINFASLLSVVLATRMEYFSDVLRTLLTALIGKTVSSKSAAAAAQHPHPHQHQHSQLMLRRTETIVEKLLTNWLAICLYDYVKEQVGPSLFLLYKAIKCQIEKGPVDQFTQEARYSLSEGGLLRQSCDYSPIVCLVLQRELDEAYETKVLDCDSISQVKSKILDSVYKNTPFSLRPSSDEVDLEWQCGQDAHVVLQDVDLTTKELLEGSSSSSSSVKAVNTLRHYGVRNKAVVSLVPRQFRSKLQNPAALGGNEYENPDQLQAGSSYSTRGGCGGVGVGSSANNTILRRDCKLFHLSQPDTPSSLSSSSSGSNSSRNPYNHTNGHPPPRQHPHPHPFFSSSSSSSTLSTSLRISSGTTTTTTATSSSGRGSCKSIPEVFLTRLLSTKGTLKKFIDDYFASITSVGHKFPYAIKWLFDIFDDCGSYYGLEPEIVKAWKSNSIPLRFWVNLIKNPDTLYDVERTFAVDSNLSVIAQTLLSATNNNSSNNNNNGASTVMNKESPSHKLLFAKETVDYSVRLNDFYHSIEKLPQVSDQEFNYHMNQLSQKNEAELNQMAALKELFIYVDKYYSVLSSELKSKNSNGQEFIQKLESISQTLCNNM